MTIEVREVLDHYGDTIVRGVYDGEYDKTNLPKELILSNYFTVRNGRIVSLVIIFINRPLTEGAGGIKGVGAVTVQRFRHFHEKNINIGCFHDIRPS